MAQINTITKTIRPANLPAVLQSILPRKFSTQGETEIVIPSRIKRGPTDILRALSKTVNRDPTAPHYKYHDDPFLIPASNYAKRSFALAQESGRKAAKWILQEHADLFQHKVADPFIDVFAPKQIITEESEVDVNSFEKALSELAVTDAVTIYQILEKKDVSLSKEQLQKLLELVCFYNGEDKSDEEWIEERWLKQGVKDRAPQRKVWKDGGVADNVFLSIDPPDAKSYSAIIIGMIKFGQLEKGWQYYEEAKSKNIRLSSDVYGSLIKCAGFVKEQYEARWVLIKELLAEMKANNIAPTIKTLNAILDSLNSMMGGKGKANALAVIAEFKNLGINPSLASYYYLISMHCRDRSRTSGILIDVMNEISGKTFAIQDPKDTFFFVTAMEICNSHLSDLTLANKINDLLLHDKNYNLIGDSYKESVYLRNYFMLKCEYETIEDFMKFYDLYVPNIYIPEPVVVEAVVRAIDMNGATSYLPKIWSDMILFDQITRERLVTQLIEAMYRNPAQDDELREKLADTAFDIWEKIQEQNTDTSIRRSNIVSWTGSMLGHLMNVLLEANRLDKATLILSQLDKDQQKIPGVPDIRPLTLFVEKCILAKDADKAIWCIQYCYDAGYEEVNKLGHTLFSKVKLTDGQLSRLQTVVKLNAEVEASN